MYKMITLFLPNRVPWSEKQKMRIHQPKNKKEIIWVIEYQGEEIKGND